MILYVAIGLFALSSLLNSISLAKMRVENAKLWKHLENAVESIAFLTREQHDNLKRFAGVYDLIEISQGIKEEEAESEKTE